MSLTLKFVLLICTLVLVVMLVACDEPDEEHPVYQRASVHGFELATSSEGKYIAPLYQECDKS